jgi:signal transduction histidine kinase
VARRLHQETANALSLAQAEHALAAEKDRLAAPVAELTRLSRPPELLEREREARASAEEGNRLKDQFLATVSHELRTPLNAILGWADMLRSHRLDDVMRDRACRSIYDNARQQARMIDELLDVARIVSGKLRLERAAVDLDQLVRARRGRRRGRGGPTRVDRRRTEASSYGRTETARGCNKLSGTCCRTR